MVRRPTRALAALLACLPATLLALLPIVLAALAAFGLPERVVGTAGLRALVGGDWFAGLVSCLIVGTLVAAVALPFGAAAAIGAWWLGADGRVIAIILGLPVILPRVALVPALRVAAAAIGWDQDYAAWALAELIPACPLLALTALLALRRFDPRLLDAASAAGAGLGARFWHVLLPLAWPGLRLGAVAAFLLPFGDEVTARLLAGPAHRPLPVLIVDGAAAGQPAAFAAAALLGAACLLLLLAAWPSRLPGPLASRP